MKCSDKCLPNSKTHVYTCKHTRAHMHGKRENRAVEPWHKQKSRQGF